MNDIGQFLALFLIIWICLIGMFSYCINVGIKRGRQRERDAPPKVYSDNAR